MNQRFQPAEIKRVSEQYAENELYKAICTIGTQLEYELKEFDWNTVANKTIVAYKEVLHNENLNGEQILIS